MSRTLLRASHTLLKTELFVGDVAMNQFFAYSVDVRFALIWLPFGVRPSKDCVTITDARLLRATFGVLKLETARDNVTGAHIIRDCRWWTAIEGPVTAQP